MHLLPVLRHGQTSRWPCWDLPQLGVSPALPWGARLECRWGHSLWPHSQWSTVPASARSTSPSAWHGQWWSRRPWISVEQSYWQRVEELSWSPRTCLARYRCLHRVRRFGLWVLPVVDAASSSCPLSNASCCSQCREVFGGRSLLKLTRASHLASMTGSTSGRWDANQSWFLLSFLIFPRDEMSEL